MFIKLIVIIENTNQTNRRTYIRQISIGTGLMATGLGVFASGNNHPAKLLKAGNKKFSIMDAIAPVVMLFDTKEDAYSYTSAFEFFSSVIRWKGFCTKETS